LLPDAAAFGEGLSRMEKNKFEPLHRLSTTHQILTAIFGGAIVNRILHALLDAVKQPTLTWWEDLLVASGFAAGIVWLLRRRSTGKSDHVAVPDEIAHLHKQLQDEVGAKMLAHGKLEQLQPRLDEAVSKYNDEVREKQRALAAERETQTQLTQLRLQHKNETKQAEALLAEERERCDRLVRDAGQFIVPNVAGAITGMTVEVRAPVIGGDKPRIRCELRIAFFLHNLGSQQVVIDKVVACSPAGARAITWLSTELVDGQIMLEPDMKYKTVVGIRIEFDDDESSTLPYPFALIATDTHNAHHWIFAQRWLISEPKSDSASARVGL
jgi:hypothetical protein